MEHHQNILGQLCRICGQRAQTKKERLSKRPAKKVQSHVNDLIMFYGIDIQGDNADQHPDKLCTICYRRTVNYKCEDRSEWTNQYIYKEEAIRTNELWLPHQVDSSDCLTCKLFEYQKTAMPRTTFLKFLSKQNEQGKILAINYCHGLTLLMCHGVF